MINLKELNDQELINFYSNLIIELKDRKIIRTKNIIWDLGEYLAVYHYNNTPGLSNLQFAPPGTTNIDAISRNWERYSVKSTSSRLTGIFYGLNDLDSKEIEKQKFEHLIIVLFKDDFILDKIIELSWDQFLKYKKWHKTMRWWNVSVTKDLMNEAKIIFEKKD